VTLTDNAGVVVSHLENGHPCFTGFSIPHLFDHAPHASQCFPAIGLARIPHSALTRWHGFGTLCGRYGTATQKACEARPSSSSHQAPEGPSPRQHEEVAAARLRELVA
jgi:hypothetical protein